MSNGMDSSLLDAYLYEENNLLDQLDSLLVADEKNGDFSSDDVNEIFRIMHTIKGSSAMMEFNAISTIAHHIEDVFFYIREKGIESLNADHKKELFNLMFQSEDYLRSEIEKVEKGLPLSEDIDTFAGEINAFLDKISNPGAAAKKAETAETSKTENPRLSGFPEDPDAVCFLHIFLEEGVGMENLRAFMVVNAVKEADIEARCYPNDMDSNPGTAGIIAEKGFFLAFDSLKAASQAQDVLASQNHIQSYELTEVPEPDPAPQPSPKEESKPAGPAPASSGESSGSGSFPAQDGAPARRASDAPSRASSAPKPAHAPVKQSLISVNLAKLNSLMDIVGEIVITESMVTSSPELKLLPRDNLDNFMKSARQLRKLTDDLQDIAMSLRMVPISGVFQKMNRIVRDMRQSLNKDVRLTIIGEETEVDKTIVDSIQDPIMHIVRNSMDHGIEETEAERIAAGKNPQGEIILSASHTSSEVVISIADDGYGMDPDRLLKKAGEKGLLTKPESEYSRKEALGLIMLPGFSTNQEVTEYSGRGVGMDVVKKNVEAVGGTISISSETGHGTTITLKIPLTLAIVNGMKITVGSSIFTIPIANIRQSFKASAEQIILDEYGNEMVERMGSFYPIIRLHNFYNLDAQVTHIEDGILLWVEANDRSYCLFVDDLIGEQQVVVKPLPAYLNDFGLKDAGIIGCTILGDGNISLILDIANLYLAAIENA
ncbi:MAG: ATP-binding protein [Clostridium sp.]